jgi:hypothetical protein
MACYVQQDKSRFDMGSKRVGRRQEREAGPMSVHAARQSAQQSANRPPVLEARDSRETADLRGGADKKRDGADKKIDVLEPHWLLAIDSATD